MGSPEKSRSFVKGDVDDRSNGKRDMNEDDEEWEGSEKRKHKLSKSKRSSNEENIDGGDGSTRRKSSGEKHDSRKMSSGSSRGDLDKSDYDMKKESTSKQAKKKQEISALEKLSNCYQDGGLENMHDSGGKSTSRSHSKTDDDERPALRKITSKFSDHEGSHRRGNNKDERAHDVEGAKALDKDSCNSERRESSREKGHVFSEDLKSRKRWDDSDVTAKVEDSDYVEKSERRSGTVSDLKHESSRERTASSRRDISDGKDKVFDSVNDKTNSFREERRADSDRPKSRSRSDAEEDNVASALSREGRTQKTETHRELRTSGHDAIDSRDRLRNPEEEGHLWFRDKSARDVTHSQRSRTPEKSGRHCDEFENSEMEYERSNSLKRKDLERDGSRDDRVKDRESNWTDRSKDREGSREAWKRRQQASSDRDVDLVHDRDRELSRRGRDRMDNERLRSGSRKDGRGEAVKASSSFGISTANYDVIEIQPKPLDYGKDDLESVFSRRSEAVSLHDPKSARQDNRVRSGDDLPSTDACGHLIISGESGGRYVDEVVSVQDSTWRDDVDHKTGRLRCVETSSPQPSGGQSSRGGSQPPHGNQEPSSFGKVIQQSVKVNRPGRGGRARAPGRDNQQLSIPVPLMGSPFGPLGMAPPGPMQPMNSGLSPATGPPVPPGVFVSAFSPPIWPGSRGVDMNIFPISPGVSSLPPGPPGHHFPPNIGAPPNPALYFNQSGQGRGLPPNASGPGFNASVPVGRGNSNDKSSGAWIPPKSGGPPGKAPSRGEQNDYSQNFVDTNLRPQNFIRELELANVEDYPKLRELIQKKDEIVAKAATPPMYHKCDLREFVLSPEFFSTKFDVILVDPPWEEYVHRAPGVTDHMEYWTFEEIMNLKIEAIADTPSFIFLWVGDGVGLEQGRQCLKKWGFRRCEDICWVKTNKHTATPALRHDSHTLFQHSKEHCLMGIKGTVRRSTDGHIIHANIDTDVIIAEEPPYGSTAKPEEMYRIIEHFALGRRRIELFGGDHNIRSGWLTVGKGLSSSNFNSEAYVGNFADKDGKVWQGGGGRNPPPDTPHLVQTTPEIESLRPKSPMKNQQQMQQQSNSISLTTPSSSGRRATGNSPQNPTAFTMHQEASSSNHPWASPMEGFRSPADHAFDMYGGYNMHPVQPSGEYLDFETRRMMNMM